MPYWALGDVKTGSGVPKPGLGGARGVAEQERLERGRRAAREGVAQVAQPLVADLVPAEVELHERLERPLGVRVLERRGEPARLLVAPAELAAVQLLRVRVEADEEGTTEGADVERLERGRRAVCRGVGQVA